MGLIRCGGCQAVIESTMPACLACGRCPGCGSRRLENDQLAPNCPQCGVSLCVGCGCCHMCGTSQDTGLAACECGHPEDSGKLRLTEQTFAFSPEKSGCLTLVLATAACAAVLAVCLQLYPA